jgi:mannonate dehydratase
MRQTWRWFGPADTVSIPEMRQAGVEGVVSALHHLPPGAVWNKEEIEKRQAEIATPETPSGLAWDVVESLPVSETIKTKGPGYADHIAAYKTSLGNLATAGISTICYNFMPVLDWTRTTLRHRLPHGGTTMYFDLVDFASFDLFLLERPSAKDDYPEDIRDAALGRVQGLSDDDKIKLQNNIVAGLPGANDNWTLNDIKDHLQTYNEISDALLRQNLIDFLTDVAPHAEDLGLRLCCHPDDPPFPLLGLPRIMSCETDYATVLSAVDIPANGITFCTGSLGVRADFDGPGFIERLGSRIHFAHLRNTTRTSPSGEARSSFFEAEHLGGDTDMVTIVRALLAEETRRKTEDRPDWQIPMRPDHGQDLLSDLDRDSMPGYPLIGRMRGLAELRGVMAGLA